MEPQLMTVASVTDRLAEISGFIWGPYCMIPALLLTGVFLTIRLRGVQIRKFFHGLACIAGYYDDPEDEGEINHFEALSAALSATIGIGNIGGVATAIHMGGPGALFWMWITAVFGMATKFASCTLSLRYRTNQEDGSIMGGPMMYIERGLGASWKWLAVVFSVCAAGATFGIGNMVQANNAAAILKDDFRIPVLVSGLAIAFLIWLVIVGGIKRIGKVASRLVPFMAILYVLGCVAILLTHFNKIPGAFRMVFHDAFTGTAATGGFLGAGFALVLRYGVARGLFSNESGLGSAPIAHAAARTEEPAREGLVAMIGPFIDTILICSLTALTIIVTGTWEKKFYNPDLSFGDVTVLQPVDENRLDRQAGNFLEDATKYSGTIHVENGEPEENVVLVFNEGIAGAPPKEDLPPSIQPEDRPEKPLIVRTSGPGLFKRILLLGETEREPFTGTVKISEGTLETKKNLTMYAKTLKNQVSLTRVAFITGFRRMAGIGSIGGLLITLAVVLFAFSTAITWSYYGDRCVEYLFGIKSRMAYRWIFVALFVVGSLVTIQFVWTLADVLNGLMALPNLFALILLSGTVVKITGNYFSRQED